jgi:hypothetical protein
VLKNSLVGRVHSGSGTKHTVFGGYWTPICGRYQLNADFFNSLVPSRKVGD